MPDQLALLVPGEAGQEFKARLLARRRDPVTSKRAAEKVVPYLGKQQREALASLRHHGPCTTQKLGALVSGFQDSEAVRLHYQFARRLPELESMGLARPTGEVRDGSRVWEAI